MGGIPPPLPPPSCQNTAQSVQAEGRIATLRWELENAKRAADHSVEDARLAGQRAADAERAEAARQAELRASAERKLAAAADELARLGPRLAEAETALEVLPVTVPVLSICVVRGESN